MHYLNLLINLIINQYFNESYCVFQLSEDGYYLSIQNYPMYIFNSSNGNLTMLKYKDNQRCQGFVIMARNGTQIFENIELFILRNSNMRYNNRKYLIILNNDEFEQFFNTRFINFVSNILVVREVTINTKNKFGNDLKVDLYFELFTHKYVGLNDNNRPVLIDKWFATNKSFLFNNDLYPNKLKNELGRIWRLGTTDYLPYSERNAHIGFELRFAMEYAYIHNLTVYINTGDDIWGTIYTNWTGIGILGGVVEDKYDVGFSALFVVPERLLYSDYSIYTAFSRVTCLVPAPIEAEGWFTYVNVLDYEIWLYIITSYITLGMLFNASTYFRYSLKKHIIYMQPLRLFGFVTTQTMPQYEMPTANVPKFALILILILTVLYVTIYNSRLSSILVVPIYTNIIKTVSDLAKSGIFWGELAIDWAIPLEKDERSMHNILYKTYRVESNDSLRALSIKNNFAFGIERLLSGYYAVGSYIHEDIIGKYVVMEEDLYRQYTCFQLRKSSIMLDSFNKLLGYATEAGLVQYWEGEAIYFTNIKVQMALKYPSLEQALIKLKFSHVKGVFMFWGIGILFAVFKFVHEFKIGNKSKKYRLQ